MFCSQCGAFRDVEWSYGQSCDIVQFCGVNPDDGITDTDISNCF